MEISITTLRHKVYLNMFDEVTPTTKSSGEFGLLDSGLTPSLKKL